MSEDHLAGERGTSGLKLLKEDERKTSAFEDNALCRI